MADRAAINQLQQMLVLREAQTAFAVEEARQARVEQDRASAERDASANDRDSAGELWIRLLGEVRCDPQLVRLSGEWLLDRQRELDVRDLDLAIADGRFDKARQDHSQALGREGAARKIRTKAEKKLEHHLDERQSMQLADAMLWRRGR